jgi:hypothetical protein
LIQKYQNTAKNLFCNFCKLVGHDEKECCAFNLMREFTVDAYSFQWEEGLEGGVLQYNTLRGYNQGGRVGFIGQGRGGFGRGRGPIICYNCNQPGYLAGDCHNYCMACTYCRQLDHSTKYYSQLIMKWWEKMNHNVHMIVEE